MKFYDKDRKELTVEQAEKILNSGGYVMFDSDKEDLIKDPVVLKQMWDLQQYAESLYEVSFSFSLVDYIRQMNYLLNSNHEAYRKIPAVQELVIKESIDYKNGKEFINYKETRLFSL